MDLNNSFDSSYFICEQVGQGAFAKVHKCYNRASGELRAVKVSTDPSSIREAKILAQLQHQAFPKVYDIYESGEKVYIVMDFLSGTSLYNYIVMNAPIKENIAIIIMKKLVSALYYLHSQNIAHMDIKPENILIDPQTLQIKIIDFGFGMRMLTRPVVRSSSMKHPAVRHKKA